MPSDSVCCHLDTPLRSRSARALTSVRFSTMARACSGSSSAWRSALNWDASRPATASTSDAAALMLSFSALAAILFCR